MENLRFDKAEFSGDTRIDETTGFLHTDAIVTRVGVFYYADSTEPGGVRAELRHPDDVFNSDSLDSLKRIPVTLGHPVTQDNPRGLVNRDNIDDFQKGYTGDKVRPDDARFVKSTMTIVSADAIDEVKSGNRKQLSLGYTQTLVRQDGEYNGVRYTHRQTNIKYNHLAIVENARAGSIAQIHLDQNDAIEIDKPKTNDNPKSSGNAMENVKITLDNGMSLEVPQHVASEFVNMQNRNKEAEKKLEAFDGFKTVKLDSGEFLAHPSVVDELEATRGKADDLKQRLDEAEKAGGNDKVKALVKDRVAAINAGQRVLPKETVAKLDGLETLEIKKLVAVEMAPESAREGLKATLDSDDTSEAYVAARFDSAVEAIPEGKPGLNPGPNNRLDEDPNRGKSPVEVAKARHDHRLVNQGKNPDDKQ